MSYDEHNPQDEDDPSPSWSLILFLPGALVLATLCGLILGEILSRIPVW